MKFTPASDYEGLLKQTKSLVTLVSNLEKQLSYYRNKDYLLSEIHLDSLQEQLESEIKTNKILTNELERLRNYY